MLLTRMLLTAIDPFEKLASLYYPFYYWTLTHIPSTINQLGLQRAHQIFWQAQMQVPAYQRFLAGRNYKMPDHASLTEQFQAIPETDKNNYVKAFPIADRCAGGHIPATQVLVDESSGSTGVPYNWVRSQTEMKHVRRSCSYFHRYWFGNQPLFIINGFSMGAWATGVTVGAALGPNGIVKSTGPDIEKILHTLRFFGPHHRYLITGYPPFLKRLIDVADAQGFDWAGYHLVATVGGEGMSETLRKYLLRRFEKVFSGYGASDLEIGIAGETNCSIALRQLIQERADVRSALIGCDQRLPMFFQYNPLDYYIETNPDHELLITINRQLLAPRVRYNIKDEGGVVSFSEVCERLASLGVDLRTLWPERTPQLPFLYVFGRRDSTLSYMGANIYPEDIEAGLFAQPEWASRIGAFCMELQENEETAELRPYIHVEVLRGELSTDLEYALRDAVRHKLYELNADFRQAVSEDARTADLQIILHRPGHGPFASLNARIKNRYLFEKQLASA